MQKHHWPAVVLAGINIVLLIIDRVIAVITGEATFITDDDRGSTLSTLTMSALLAVTFLTLGWVVHREAARFATTRRAARVARPILTYGLFFLGIGFLVTPLRPFLGNEESLAGQISDMAALLALTAVFLSGLVLGLAVIGRNPLGIGGRVLSALGPAIVVTGLIAVVAPDLASPVYCTMVVLAGTALIGVRATPIAQPERRAAISTSTSTV